MYSAVQWAWVRARSRCRSSCRSGPDAPSRAAQPGPGRGRRAGRPLARRRALRIPPSARRSDCLVDARGAQPRHRPDPRRAQRLRFAPDLVLESEWPLSPTVNAMFHESEIEDDQLRMMFSCCPPNLPPQSQLSLVLKLLCGFGNGEIAAALLVSEAAVEKQLARGKRTLVRARVLYEVGGREQIGERLESVQRALYLLFSEGYHGSQEPVRAGLCGEAMRLCA